MTKKTAHHGGAPAPYTRKRKVRYSYNSTPLHNPNEGIPVTRKNLVAFYTRKENFLALRLMGE